MAWHGSGAAADALHRDGMAVCSPRVRPRTLTVAPPPRSPPDALDLVGTVVARAVDGDGGLEPADSIAAYGTCRSAVSMPRLRTLIVLMYLVRPIGGRQSRFWTRAPSVLAPEPLRPRRPDTLT